MKLKLFNVELDAPLRPGEVEYSNLALTRLLDRVLRGLRLVAAIGFVLVLANGAGTWLSKVDSNNKDAHLAASDHRISAQQEQIKGTLVGVCAIPNVNRVFVANALHRLEALGLHTDATPEQVTEAFKASYEELGLVDCKALLPAEDRVKICLQYPPEIGVTTSTTEDQPACRDEP